MKTTKTQLFVPLLALCLALANCWIVLRNPLNNDVAWYLYLGRELLSGKRLYIDFVETNPPLICFLSVIPVWLAQVLHTDAKIVWTVLVTTVCLGSAATSARFWSSARGGRPGEAAVIFLFLLVVTQSFFFAFDFGQRDHLGLIASLPVCGLIAARTSSSRLKEPGAVAVSVAAGLLLALKPHFLLPWFLCLAWALVVCGWKRVARWPETWIVPAMSLTQPALIIFAAPAYLGVARLVASLYSSYNAASWGTLLTDRFLLVSLVGGTLAFFFPASPKGRNSIRFASLATLGWFLSALLQRKGWHYHALPGVAALTLTAWMILLDTAGRPAAQGWRWQTAVRTFTILVLLVAGFRTLRLHWGYPAGNDNLIPIVDREPRGSSIVALATGMTVFPLVNDTGTRLGIRYNALWLLPGIYSGQVHDGTPDGRWHYHRPDQMGAPEKEMFSSVASDLAAEPPLLILLRGEQQGMGSLKTDLIGYFAQDPRAGAALRHYELAPVPGDFMVLRHVPHEFSAAVAGN